MLESILNPRKAANNLLEIFLVSSLFTTVSILVSYLIFPDCSSIVFCFFVTLLFAPFFQRLFAHEETKEELAIKHRIHENLFRRHEQVIKIYSAFFLGMIITLSVYAVFLPDNIKHVIFRRQYEEIERISQLVSGRFFEFENIKIEGLDIQKQFTAERIEIAKMIFKNNSMVLFLSFLLSLIFGTGALLIFSWNASVIAAYVSGYVFALTRRGMDILTAYALGLPSALLAITLHGIPEILGYFFAGLAGGILSVGLIKERFGSKEMLIVVADSLLFLGVGFFSIFVGAFIETSEIIYGSIAFLAYILFLILLFHKGEFKVD